MSLAAVALDDKYVQDKGRVYLTGTQALVRLPLMQRRRDLAAGLNTAGYITGYRGSPLGGLNDLISAGSISADCGTSASCFSISRTFIGAKEVTCRIVGL